MSTPTVNILDTVAYTAGNVVPATRVRPSRQVTLDPSRFTIERAFFPDAIVPLLASGGFNSVVELSASACLRHAASHLDLQPIDRSVTESELAQLVALGSTDGPLSRVAASSASLSANAYRGFRLTLRPMALDFPDARTVCIDFRADIVFVRPSIKPPRPVPGPNFPSFDPRWSEGLPPEIAGIGPQPPMMAMMSSDQPAHSFYATSMPAIASEFVNIGVFTPAAPEQPFTVPVGSFMVKCCAPLGHADDPTRCRTVVYADLRDAEWTETPPPAAAPGETESDVRRVYDAYFADWLQRVSWIVEGPSSLPIAPTISLVGRNAGGAAVPEFADFDVRAFAVTGDAGKALAVAFDTAPGCKGFIEDVDHFIGPYDYGVISDEFVVDRVFRHKWNRGGFDRRINVQAPTRVKVKRNGKEREEDAIVYGYQDLLTLDWVTITTESNTRGDYVRLGGQAQSVPTKLRMVADGQTFNAGDADLGPPEPGEWGIFADLDLLRQLHPDLEIRAFQKETEQDGSRHLARPFAFFRNDGSGIAVKYARVEGVSKHVFFLGDMSSVLT